MPGAACLRGIRAGARQGERAPRPTAGARERSAHPGRWIDGACRKTGGRHRNRRDRRGCADRRRRMPSNKVVDRIAGAALRVVLEAQQQESERRQPGARFDRRVSTIIPDIKDRRLSVRARFAQHPPRKCRGDPACLHASGADACAAAVVTNETLRGNDLRRGAANEMDERSHRRPVSLEPGIAGERIFGINWG